MLGVDRPMKALSKHIQNLSKHIQNLIWEKLSKFSQLSFCQKYFFLNQTPSCICSMCLHCIEKDQIVPLKAVQGVDRLMKALFKHIHNLIKENCLSSHSCHFVKNYFYLTKLLHAYVQCVYIV